MKKEARTKRKGKEKKEGGENYFAVIGFIFSVFSLVYSASSLVRLFVAIFSFVMCIIGMRKPRRWAAVIGIMISLICVILSLYSMMYLSVIYDIIATLL
jgi:hypothetical protein